jgi:hypothetical protein
MSADLDRFKTRLNESEAMKEEKSDLQLLQTQFYEQVREWEQERVFNAIKDSFKGELYFDDADTFIQTVKNNLQNKGK